jgi:hypothetical protein
MKNYEVIRNFISTKAVDLAVQDLCQVMATSSCLKEVPNIDTLRTLYLSSKNNPNWGNIYDSFGHLSFWNEIKKEITAKESFNKVSAKDFITVGVRIMDYSSERFYPLHQEWPNMPRSPIILWIPLHVVDYQSGGLLLESMYTDSKLPHLVDERGYHILEKQEELRSLVSPAQKLYSGDALIFNELCIHGTSPMKSSANTRFALIIRIYKNSVSHPFIN